MSTPRPDNAPINPLAGFTQDQLIDMWAAHRNDLDSVMAANEIVKRLYLERKAKEQQ